MSSTTTRSKKKPTATQFRTLEFLRGGSLAPPARLSVEAQEQWTAFTLEFDFDDQSLMILLTSLEAFDRMRQAQRELAEHGSLTFVTRYGEPKPHPASAVENRSRAAYVAGLKSLGLDLEPLKAPGRPAGS